MPDQISMLCKRSLHINTVGIPLYFSKPSYLLDIQLRIAHYELRIINSPFYLLDHSTSYLSLPTDNNPPLS